MAFINYDPNYGYTVRTYRNNGIYCTGKEMKQEVKNGNECCCDYNDMDNLSNAARKAIIGMSS